MNRRPLAGLVLPILVAAAAAAPVSAQGECRPGKDSHEANTMAQLSVPLAFAPLGGGAPRATRAWAALEISYVPDVDAETRTPTVCRPGKEPENANVADVLPRPRLGVILPAGFSLEASWIPPIRVNQVRANLVGLALRWTTAPAPRWTLTLRAHATVGELRAPVTCSDDALADPTSECFGGTRSDDRFHPNIVGADASLGWTIAGGRLRPYAGAGYSHLASRFQVQFVNRVGTLDDTRVVVDLDRATVFGGALWTVTRGLDAGGEIYAVPADGVTGRLVVRARFGT